MLWWPVRLRVGGDNENQRLQESYRAKRGSSIGNICNRGTFQQYEYLLWPYTVAGQSIFVNVKFCCFSYAFPKTIDYEQFGLETISQRRFFCLSVNSYTIQHINYSLIDHIFLTYKLLICAISSIPAILIIWLLFSFSKESIVPNYISLLCFILVPTGYFAVHRANSQLASVT